MEQKEDAVCGTRAHTQLEHNFTQSLSHACACKVKKKNAVRCAGESNKA